MPDQPTPRAPERLLHNGHTYEPGRDEDAFDLRDPRWCNTCGEGIDKPLERSAREDRDRGVTR